MFDVIIVGGGPTGMMLAAELRLHDIDVLVLERDAEPNPAARSLGLHARSAEILDQRGLLRPFLELGKQYPGAARFAGIDQPWPADLDTAHRYVLGIAQPITDRLLAEHAERRGAVVRRAVEVVGFTATDEEVSVELADGTSQTARWLVGCDGGRSLVRKQLGIDFTGDPAQTEWILAEVAMTASAEEITAASARVREHHRGFGIGPAGDGLYRAVVPAASVSEDRTTPPTLEEFNAQLSAFAGTDFGAHSPRSITRFTDATRLADRYRAGRVFIAGDAAHVHPPLGGQGLNLGIQDAFNLGWKLAAQVRGWAPDDLLDSYEAERRPVAADVLDLTRVQSVLIATEPGPRAVRRLVGELMGIDEVNRLLVERIIGTGIRYDFGDDTGGLVGRRLADRTLGDGSRLYEHLRAGRGVLLDSTASLDVGGWADRVDAIMAGAIDLAAPAVLLRPDGHVAWAGDDPASLHACLERWFGEAGQQLGSEVR